MAEGRNTTELWARFRFTIIGSLLSAPPERGTLKREIRDIAQRTWTHPITGAPIRFSAVTIERWYYAARRERDDPIRPLRRAKRRDAGRFTIPPGIREQIFSLHLSYSDWSYQLHYDNLRVLAAKDPELGQLPSYSTVRRFMKARGLLKTPKKRAQRPGQVRAAQHRERREVRSFEAAYVGSLYHLDFHQAPLRVLTSSGRWVQPYALGVLDDHSRVACHVQWYLGEGAEELVHGLSQAIQKRGLPRALLTDNGSAMISDEVRDGLFRLGVLHETTLAYSPYQNGKQEVFWSTLEGRLMKMLSRTRDLSLDFLNRATQAWVELEYNRTEHSEIQETPIARFARAPSVLRDSPSSAALREAFVRQVTRAQRRSDGTFTVDRVRFEVPSRFRHFERLTIRYARWDLSRLLLVDPTSGRVIAPLYPLDRTKNASGVRAAVEARASETSTAAEEETKSPDTLPPLLEKLLSDYEADGLPPGYVSKPDRSPKGGAE